VALDSRHYIHQVHGSALQWARGEALLVKTNAWRRNKNRNQTCWAEIL